MASITIAAIGVIRSMPSTLDKETRDFIGWLAIAEIPPESPGAQLFAVAKRLAIGITDAPPDSAPDIETAAHGTTHLPRHAILIQCRMEIRISGVKECPPTLSEQG